MIFPTASVIKQLHVIFPYFNLNRFHNLFDSLIVALGKGQGTLVGLNNNIIGEVVDAQSVKHEVGFWVDETIDGVVRATHIGAIGKVEEHRLKGFRDVELTDVGKNSTHG